MARGQEGEGRERPLLLNLAVLAYSSLLWLVLPRRAVVDPAEVPGLAGLEDGWADVRAELDRYAAAVTPPPVQALDEGMVYATRDEGWKMVLLRAYGHDVPTTAAAFPRTMALVDAIPGATNAMFSIFEPGKAVRWHVGVLKGIRRCHLGVSVPEGDCGIQVARRTCRWEDGRVLVFDDSFPHRAFNRTGRRRVILMVDVVQPMPWPWLDRLHRRVVARVGTTRRYSATRRRAEERAAADAGAAAA